MKINMPTTSVGVFRYLFRCGAALEDFSDRLNHFWTFGLLLLLACITSWKQGTTKPIVCNTPVEFTTQMSEYAESSCWHSYFIQYPRDREKVMEELGLSGPSFMMFKNVMPFVSSRRGTDMKSKMMTTITMYQWLPVIFCFLAFLYKIPHMLMYILHGYSGMNFDKLYGLTEGYGCLNLEDRQRLGKLIARYLYCWCKLFDNCLPWRWLTVVWMLIKFLYCVNAIVQMCVLDAFLRTSDPPVDNSTSYGDVISTNLFTNNATLWRNAPPFPRQVMCDFAVFQRNNIHMYSVQCQLPINEFNEFVCMFVWMWLIFVSTVTSLSLVVWLLKTFIPLIRKRYLSKMLNLSETLDLCDGNPGDLESFSGFVGEDGVYALKLISTNSSEHVTRDVICNMWLMRQTELRNRLTSNVRK